MLDMPNPAEAGRYLQAAESEICLFFFWRSAMQIVANASFTQEGTKF